MVTMLYLWLSGMVIIERRCVIEDARYEKRMNCIGYFVWKGKPEGNPLYVPEIESKMNK